MNKRTLLSIACITLGAYSFMQSAVTDSMQGRRFTTGFTRSFYRTNASTILAELTAPITEYITIIEKIAHHSGVNPDRLVTFLAVGRRPWSFVKENEAYAYSDGMIKDCLIKELNDGTLNTYPEMLDSIFRGSGNFIPGKFEKLLVRIDKVFEEDPTLAQKMKAILHRMGYSEKA